VFGWASLLMVGWSLLVPEGRPAPRLEATTLEGADWSEQLTGQVTIVEFFATWCPHCRRSLPGYQRLQETRPVRLIIVDVEEDPALVAAFFTEHPPPTGAGVLVDPDGRASRAFGVKGFPSGVLIDQAGIVRSSFSGWSDADVAHLAAMIDELRRPPAASGESATARRSAPAAAPRRRGGKKNVSAPRPRTHDERARDLGVEVLR
jgi:thiol-disulfide isomerase/thioredoxin